ncbi:MAG: twin-arginine translocation signal domain-containing protein, partial [Planctomycetaceae bacterium]|nr:twin-arginine translocation signal domain-containing protein [Planctomycetaceae bacterium]
MSKTIPSSNRREFMKKATLAATAGTLAVSGLSRRVHAAEDNTIKVALVGCGGRGNGAVLQALSTEGPTKLVATSDFFAAKAAACVEMVKEQYRDNPDKVDVPKERQFAGLAGYKHAIDAVGPGGVILLATPPTFRPLHVEYAVEKGVHVFMEKSFAVDAPGIRRVLKAGKLATEKNLKVASGLMSRHSYALDAAMEQIHGGLIGDLVTCWAYREHGAIGLAPKQPNESELAHQIRNYSNYTWINGGFILDWLIHNLDVCCWAKNSLPVSAQGQGGRASRRQKDQVFDHYAIEYRFGDGTTLFAQGRHIDNCWGFFGSKLHGVKGAAILGEGISKPKIYKSWQTTDANVIWEHTGEFNNFYQTEHDKLFAAIRNDTPYNEAERSAHSAMVGILGLMAAETGQEITWDDAIASNVELAPGL